MASTTTFRTEADYDGFERQALAAAVAPSDVDLGDAATVEEAFEVRLGQTKGLLRRQATRRQVPIG